MRAILLPGLAMLAMPPLHAADAAGWLRRDAEVRSAEDARLLYRESHFIRTGARSERWVAYRCPDGAAFARKHVQGGSAAPAFALEDGRGYAEGLHAGSGTRTAYAGGDGDRSERSVRVPADGVADAGFDAAVRANWDALMRGQALRLHFLVPSRHRFYPLRVQRAGSLDWRGIPAERLRMRLDSWFGFAVPEVRLVYARDDRRLLEFAGTGNIRDARGGNPQVRIAFEPRARAVDDAQVAALRGDPLRGRCAI